MRTWIGLKPFRVLPACCQDFPFLLEGWRQCRLLKFILDISSLFLRAASIMNLFFIHVQVLHLNWTRVCFSYYVIFCIFMNLHFVYSIVYFSEFSWYSQKQWRLFCYNGHIVLMYSHMQTYLVMLPLVGTFYPFLFLVLFFLIHTCSWRCWIVLISTRLLFISKIYL